MLFYLGSSGFCVEPSSIFPSLVEATLRVDPLRDGGIKGRVILNIFLFITSG